MKNKMRPIIKWTGGKYNEFVHFEQYIPSFTRYIEPFFGGGGVFFALQPSGETLINDKSTDLINFYKQIGASNFKNELLKYADLLDELKAYTIRIWPTVAEHFEHFLKNSSSLNELKEKIVSGSEVLLLNNEIFNDITFVPDCILFKKVLFASIVDKIRRIKNISTKEQRQFNSQELYAHFETGIRSGAYHYFRDLLNLHFKKKIDLAEPKAAANWYFVREYCYGAMFRFNAKGEFNIPYGGIAYNKKNFRQKVEKIFDQNVVQLMGNAKITNLDFEIFLENINLNKKDFIFLDPPYDSEFSEYDQNAFTREDQQRLANLLINCKAQWMVVIKDTPYIREIYNHKNVKISSFGKKYTYNVRGRNNREVNHLIITNY